MKQLSIAATDFVKKPKQTRREKFLAEMETVVPWSRLLGVVAPSTPRPATAAGSTSCPSYCVSTSCSTGSATPTPAMEEALHDIPLLRRFAGRDAGVANPELALTFVKMEN